MKEVISINSHTSAGEILAMAAPWLEKQMHPRVIIGGYNRALQDAMEHLKTITRPVDIKNDDEMIKLIKSCLGTSMQFLFSISGSISYIFRVYFTMGGHDGPFFIEGCSICIF